MLVFLNPPPLRSLSPVAGAVAGAVAGVVGASGNVFGTLFFGRQLRAEFNELVLKPRFSLSALGLNFLLLVF